MSDTVVMEHKDHGGAVHPSASGPARLVEFLKDTREEMRKVSVPTREQVQATTTVVIATVFLFAAFFELVDLVLGRGIDQMFLHLTKH